MSAAPHAVLLYPPIHAVAAALRIWTLYYGVNFPLALLRLGSLLRARGYRVTLLDAFHPPAVQLAPDELARRLLTPERIVRQAPLGPFEQAGRTEPIYRIGLTRDELAARLRALGPVDEVYISSIFTWTWTTTHEAVELCKEIHPNAVVHLGGIYPTLCPERARQSGADDVHVGELEGLTSQWPDLSLTGRHDIDASVLKTSLGCPNACTYCAVHLLEGRRMRYRDPDDVVREVVHLNRTFGIRDFHFWESNLLLRSERHFEPLLEKLIATGLPLSFLAPEGIQTNLITPALAQLMHRAGFKNVYLAVETTDAEWGKRTKRPTGFAQLQQAVTALREAGFRREQLLCVLLIGQPDQTRAAILRDILSVFSLGCTVALLFYTLIPGTVEFDRRQDAVAGRPLEDLDPLLFPFATPTLTVDDLTRLQRYFNFRHFPLERIRRSGTTDDLLREAQDLLARGDYAHDPGA